MKIYLAGRFSRRSLLEQWGNQLQQHGHEIVSRWSMRDSDHKLVDGLSPQAADHERLRFALEDCEDVQACDCVISIMEEPRSNGRGGRHVEFGYALALRKRLIIVGPRETVFHHLPEVEHYDDWPSALAVLAREAA